MITRTRVSIVIIIFIGLAFFLCLTKSSAQTFTASTSINAATTAEFVATQVDSNFDPDPANHTWIGPATTFDFGALNAISGTLPDGRTWTTFLPRYYYAIDVALLDGVIDTTAPQSVSLALISATPSGDVGLAKKGLVGFVKTSLVSFETGETVDEPLAKVTFDTAQTITLDQVTGGWLRMYVGIATGDPAANEPADAATFSPADAAGDYTAVITFTFVP